MEEIIGIVESVVFKSEDTGYTVIRINAGGEIVAAVGILPTVEEGINLKLKGTWILHKKFGKQFNVKEYEEIRPTTKEAIKKYLSSGIIKGIGPITAKKIIDHFGEKSLEIIENNIERLKEIEGIGKKKYSIIYESYMAQKGLKDIILFFQEHGVTNAMCLKIYKTLGENTIAVVKDDPYVLCEKVRGIGFKIADRIAMSLGVEKDSEGRIKNGVLHIINNYCGAGNTYMPKDMLERESARILEVKVELVKICITNLILEERLVGERVGEIDGIFVPYYLYAELSITQKIIKLGMMNFQKIDADIPFEIELFEKKNGICLAPSQRMAIEGAFNQGIQIITGGPGTGKTTIIKCIIDIYQKYNMKVLLGAPTGRAAKRMTESTGRDAKTIHRLLEVGSGDDDTSMFMKGEDEPLDGDVIIIDEASMIDVSLMSSLLKAIKLGTRLIIVGDVDQLPSVGPGNVLRDLINSNYVPVVKLKEIFRQGKESYITLNAHKINNGQMPTINNKEGDFFFLREKNFDKISDLIIDLINRRLPKFNGNWDRLRDMQILTPTRKGELGVYNLNNKLQQVMNPPSKNKKEHKYRDITFREGDKVMQVKNNYNLNWHKINDETDEGVGVFNGDMGFIEKIDVENRSFTIIFDDERKVLYDFEYLDELDLAYSITIHKSQGSEFKVVIIPVFMGAPFLMNRNLLYTGITRAKELLVVVGSMEAMSFMINNTKSMNRYSSLEYRIKSILSEEDLFEG